MTRMKLILAAAAVVLVSAPALAQDNPYGPDFYRAESWSGEYPAGFTVLEDTTLMLRPQLDPAAEASIDCPVTKGATFHTWNIPRSISDGLAFVSFTRIEEMEVKDPIDIVVYGEIDPTDVTLSLKPGDTWRYLVYYGEGAFLMERDGVRYVADQSLVDASTSALTEDQREYHEWLRINCSNNLWGWFSMDELAEHAELGSPNITTYGMAADAE
jgi:hypothetical protein